MASKYNLQKLVDEMDEAGADMAVSKIFSMSAEFKKSSRLVRDENDIDTYYLNISSKGRRYTDELKEMDITELEVFYDMVNYPILFADVKNGKLEYFEKKFEGLSPSYTIHEKPVGKDDLERLLGSYRRARRVDFGSDLKYVEMYGISAEIKNKGVKVILKDEEKKTAFYLTELSSLGKNGKMILDYLYRLDSEDAKTFSNIANMFSIVDMEGDKIYTMESFKNDAGESKVKLAIHDDMKKDYDVLYNVLKLAGKNPNGKVVYLNINEMGDDYHSDMNSPSDMYG